MATLRIDVSNPMLNISGLADEPELRLFVARLDQLLDESGGKPDQVRRFEIVVGFGANSSAFDVEPGLWSVQLVLPSGNILSEQVEAIGVQDAVVRFELSDSPHEWMALEFLEGSVPSRRRYEQDRPSPSLPPRPEARLARMTRKSVGTPAIYGKIHGGQTDAEARSVTQVTLLRSKTEPGTSYHAAERQFAGALDWWKGLSRALRFEAQIEEGTQTARIDDNQVRIGPEDDWNQQWQILLPPGDHQRHFALVVTRHSVELLSMPLPWASNHGFGNATVQLLVSKSPQDPREGTNIALRDPESMGLLSYLKNGSLAVAASVAEDSVHGDNRLIDTLQGKVHNPLAACAAAYALIGARDLTKPASWHDWVSNLSNWFGGIPDGAILEAKMRSLQGVSDREQLKAAYIKAFRRGLPYYSLGISWLLDGLRQFNTAQSDADAIEAADVLSQVALRTNTDQVFTSLRARRPASFPLDETDDV